MKKKDAFENLHTAVVSLWEVVNTEWSWRGFFGAYFVAAVIGLILYYLGVR
jgi:hypothetical protein